MLHVARLEVWIISIDLPYFFQANAVVLKTGRIFIKFKSPFEVFCERTTGAFTKDSLFSHYFHAWHVVIFLAAIFAYAKGTCYNAFNLTIFTFND